MSSGKNVCNCPDPPGGQAVCSENQLAICRVIGGRVKTECHSPPEGVTAQGLDALHNWALSHITRSTRTLGQSMSIADHAILGSGRYIDPITGEEVTFGLPTSFFFKYEHGA